MCLEIRSLFIKDAEETFKCSMCWKAFQYKNKIWTFTFTPSHVLSYAMFTLKYNINSVDNSQEFLIRQYRFL